MRGTAPLAHRTSCILARNTIPDPWESGLPGIAMRGSPRPDQSGLLERTSGYLDRDNSPIDQRNWIT